MSALIDPCRIRGAKEVRLECWTCNKRRLERLAGKWIRVVDFRYQRKLAFCTEACRMMALTRKGFYKKLKPRV